jgi:radical SAM superfamily enzyme YgiQ (UPF0313 family)
MTMPESKKILLVNPNIHPYFGRYVNCTFTLGDMYPLGLLNLASYLQKNGYAVKIFDALDHGADEKNVGSVIRDYAPDIVGLTHSLYCSFPPVLNIAKLCKKINPRITTVIGGILPSYLDNEILANCDAIDFVIKGEGEYPFLRLIKSLCRGDSLNNIERLSYRGKTCAYSAKKDYMTIPDFAIEPLRINKLFIAGSRLSYFRKGANVYIEASRGCRYSCKFCIINNFSCGVKYKDPKQLVGEIEGYLTDFGITSFRFTDSTFTENRKFVYSILDEIANRNLQKKIKWSCSTRVDCVDRDLLKDMRKSGCVRIGFGVESYSQQDLDYYRKRITLEQVIESFRLTKENGIKTAALLILDQYRYRKYQALREELKKVAVLLRSIKPDFMIYAPLIIYPNTLIYDEYLKLQVIEKDGWRSLLNGHLVPSFPVSESYIFSLINRAKLSFIAAKCLNRFVINVINKG